MLEVRKIIQTSFSKISDLVWTKQNKEAEQVGIPEAYQAANEIYNIIMDELEAGSPEHLTKAEFISKFPEISEYLELESLDFEIIEVEL